MNNIEKFNRITELNALKSEYHKRELISLVTLEKGLDTMSKDTQTFVQVGKMGLSLYQQIKSLFKKQ